MTLLLTKDLGSPPIPSLGSNKKKLSPKQLEQANAIVGGGFFLTKKAVDGMAPAEIDAAFAKTPWSNWKEILGPKPGATKLTPEQWLRKSYPFPKTTSEKELTKLKATGVSAREVALIAIANSFSPSRECVSNTMMAAAKAFVAKNFQRNAAEKITSYIETGGARNRRGQHRQGSSFHGTKKRRMSLG